MARSSGRASASASPRSADRSPATRRRARDAGRSWRAGRRVRGCGRPGATSRATSASVTSSSRSTRRSSSPPRTSSRRWRSARRARTSRSRWYATANRRRCASRSAVRPERGRCGRAPRSVLPTRAAAAGSAAPQPLGASSFPGFVCRGWRAWVRGGRDGSALAQARNRRRAAVPMPGSVQCCRGANRCAQAHAGTAQLSQESAHLHVNPA